MHRRDQGERTAHPASSRARETTVPERVRRVLAGGGETLVLSPHLDDGVLSCASLVAALEATGRVTVLTVFSEASPPPHTRAARSFLRTCASGGAAELFAARRAEDREALELLGARQVHLGLVDALFRRRGERPSRLGRLLPELDHRYPTYRFDIALGRVSRSDPSVETALHLVHERLDVRPDLVLAPLGVGRHVDHLITRELGRRLSEDPVYYADFPYILRTDPDEDFIEDTRLRPWTWTGDGDLRQTAIAAYRSQVPGLFPGSRVPEVPETYYSPKGQAQ